MDSSYQALWTERMAFMDLAAVENIHHLLPPELWIEIFSCCSPVELFSSISPSCSYFYRLISFYQGSLPRIPVTLHVRVQETNESDQSVQPSIEYAISVQDQCEGPSISSRMKTLFVSSSDGQWKAELESREGFTETIDDDVLIRLLSWMEVCCLEVEASKEVAEKSSGRFYDTLNLILQWTASCFGAVSIRKVTLSSQHSTIDWRPNEQSMELIESLALDSLKIEIMPSMEMLSAPLSIPSLVLTHANKKPMSELKFYTMGREYFHSLLTSPYPIYHKLYADAPALLATVTPADLADFVVVWRASPSPASIACLSFNSAFSFPDLRSTVRSKGLARIFEEIPYCRYRTAHSVHKNIGLELVCYGNEMSTQWQLRTGEMSALI
ncbi:hypothetical protein PRIPAC_76990 [Pristionchus pacificus]|uniref:Uncharacterized protein n=1 Tax=Pristionchus pacificus TaxID=54126 RepID=A0A2A6BHS6_PRIPA|nr:hypothetical protein PRIPAC_76990 [Pristionchus pacificus]|eukprot:PDM65398.1 hypothetical protein PRIPAC_52340 [Pristionchus pacificus]